MNDAKIAKVVLIAVIVLSIVFGGYRSLSKEASKVERVFFDGVDKDGYSINSDLNNLVDISRNLITVAKRYLPENDASIIDLADASSKVANSSKPSDKLRAFRELQTAFTSLSKKLGPNLEENDRRYLEGFTTEFNSSTHKISLDGYNEKAKEFNSQLSRFPASLLGYLYGMRPFELTE